MGSRVLAMALCASCFLPVAIMIIVGHLLMMFLVGFVKIKILMDIPSELLRIIIYIFDYFDYKNSGAFVIFLRKHSHSDAIIYYQLVFVENYAMIILWYLWADHNEVTVAKVQLIIVLGGFWIGIIFMLLHYNYCLKRRNIHLKDKHVLSPRMTGPMNKLDAALKERGPSCQEQIIDPRLLAMDAPSIMVDIYVHNDPKIKLDFFAL